MSHPNILLVTTDHWMGDLLGVPESEPGHHDTRGLNAQRGLHWP